MLSEITAEVLHFLTRRDLDKAYVVSRQFNGVIAQCGDVYPLRPVQRIAVYQCSNDSTLKIWISDGFSAMNYHPFSDIDEALSFVGSILRHSYVTNLQMGYERSGSMMPLLPDHWTTLIDATRSGGVQLLQFYGVDFSALEDDALRVVVGWRGLRSLVVERCVVPSRFVTDDLLRAGAAHGVRRLRICDNESDTPHRFSDDAVMDYFFLDNAPEGGQSPDLVFEGTGLTDTFLQRFSSVFYRVPPALTEN